MKIKFLNEPPQDVNNIHYTHTHMMMLMKSPYFCVLKQLIFKLKKISYKFFILFFCLFYYFFVVFKNSTTETFIPKNLQTYCKLIANKKKSEPILDIKHEYVSM